VPQRGKCRTRDPVLGIDLVEPGRLHSLQDTSGNLA
jgi:hypothetical protein